MSTQTSAKITAKDVHGQTYEVNVADLTWRPSVYGIVIEDDKLLMPKQFKTKYDLPGGGVDLGEDLEQAVIREVKEETGIDVEVIKLVGFKTSIFYSSHDRNGGQAYHSLLFYFLCKKVGGELSTDGFDEEEQVYAELAEWIPLSRLNEIDISSTVEYRDIVKEAIRGN